MKDNIKFYVNALLFVIVGTLGMVGLYTSHSEGLIQTSQAVQIPQVLIDLFNGLLITVLTIAFHWILTKIGLDLTAFTIPLAITLGTFFTGLVQGWINLQPVSSDPFIQTILNVLVVILSGVGGLALLARSQSRNSLL